MSLVKNTKNQAYNELFIANQIITKNHQALLIAGVAQEVAHQIIAIRYLKNKYGVSNGKEWLDTYSDRFGGIIDSMQVCFDHLKDLKEQLSILETEVLVKAKIKKVENGTKE